MEAATSVISMSELKRILFSIVDHELSVCIRYRTIGQLWYPNFLRIIKIEDGKRIVLLDQTRKRIISLPDFSTIRLDLSNITIVDLIAAAREVYAKETEKQALGTVISAPKITIREKIEMISRKLGAAEHARFRELLGENPTRIEIVVTFLALLELVKRYQVAARQDGLFADIEIKRMDDWNPEEEIEIEFE